MAEHLVPTAVLSAGAGAINSGDSGDVFDFVMKGSGGGSHGSPAATGGTGGYATRNKAHAPGGNTHGAGSHTQTKAKENKRNNKGQTTVAPPEASAATGEGNNDNGSYPHAPPQFPNAMFAMHVPPFADTNIAPMSYNNVGPAMPSGGYAPVTTNTAAGEVGHRGAMATSGRRSRLCSRECGQHRPEDERRRGDIQLRTHSLAWSQR